MLASFEELAAISSLSASEVGGAVRLASPTAYGARRLAGPLAVFATQHPKVRIDLHTTEDEVDLVEDRIDLGVWVGGDLPKFLVARRIGVEPVGLFAAPAYLSRTGHLDTRRTWQVTTVSTTSAPHLLAPGSFARVIWSWTRCHLVRR